VIDDLGRIELSYIILKMLALVTDAVLTYMYLLFCLTVTE